MTQQELKLLALELISNGPEGLDAEAVEEKLLDKAVKEMLNGEVQKYSLTTRNNNVADTEIVSMTVELYWYECGSLRN